MSFIYPGWLLYFLLDRKLSILYDNFYQKLCFIHIRQPSLLYFMKDKNDGFKYLVLYFYISEYLIFVKHKIF